MNVEKEVKDAHLGTNQSFLLEFWQHFWRRFSSKLSVKFHSLLKSSDESNFQAFFHAFFKNDSLRSSQQSLDFHSLFSDSIPALEFKKELFVGEGGTMMGSEKEAPLIGRKKKRGEEGDLPTRSSRFRGVSKNGNQWQVLIMINKKKRYIGSFSTQEQAAREYDKVAIKYNFGKSRPNFFYTEEEIHKIMSDDSIIKIN